MALCLVMTAGFWSCNDEDVDGNEPMLTVEPTALTFAASGDELTKSFQVTANREWSIQVTGEDTTWLSVSTLKGEGQATVNVTVLPNANDERTVSLKITSSINTANVSIVQAAGNGSGEKTVILDENIGNENVEKDNWPNVNNFAGWKKGGIGAESVTYKASNASVRSNSFSDHSSSTSDYSKNRASGGNNILLKGGATLDVCGITLTEAQTKLKLTFGIVRSEYDNFNAPYKNEEFTVALSVDGEKWTEPITYTRSDYSSWDLASADFTLSKATTKLYIRFTAVSVDGRIDDITLSTGNGGQTVDLDKTSGGGDSEDDGSVDKYPTTVVSSFTEVFDGIENNKIFDSENWGFYSNDKQYATTPALGWQGKTFSDGGKYIAVAPFNSSLSEVVAYAIMPPFDVKAAASKTLTFDLAWYYKTKDDSKIEVVASKDFNGNVKTATWAVVKDCTFDTQKQNDWFSLSADLSAYANDSKVYVAFRYTGKSNTYRLDNVAFATAIGLSFGTPDFSGILKAGTAISGAKITIPYSHAKGTESFDITVAVSGDAAAGIDPITNAVHKTLAEGSGEIELDITGTPTVDGGVTFTINGIDGLTDNTVDTKVASSEAPDYTSNLMPEKSNSEQKINVEKAIIEGTEYSVLKFGTSKATGNYTTTALDKTGGYTLSFYGLAWKGKTGAMKVTVNGGGTIDGASSKTFSLKGNDGATGNPTYTLTVSPEEFFSAKLEGVTVSTTLTFETVEGSGDPRALLVGLNIK